MNSICKATDTATFDAEFSDKAEFQNEQNEQNETSEHGIAEEFNRKSVFQHGNEIITVSLEWNMKTYGYEVTLHSSADNLTRLVTKACGYIRASRDYRNYCILSMEEVFTVKINGSSLLDFKTE